MNGKAHAVGTILAAAAILTAGTKLDLPISEVTQVCYGCLIGLALTPDLDQVENTYGSPWRIVWWLYGNLIPHRSPLSHIPVLGTALRLAYAGAILAAPISIYLYLGGTISVDPDVLFRLFVGLAISDFMHALLDIRRKKWFIRTNASNARQ